MLSAFFGWAEQLRGETRLGGTSLRLCEGREEAHVGDAFPGRRTGFSYQPASRKPPVCGECAAGPRKRQRVRVELRTVKQPPNRGLAQGPG